MTKDQQKRYEELKDWMANTDIRDWDFIDVRPGFRNQIEQLAQEEREYLQKLIDEL